jgi:hypothetical protein
MVTVNSLLNRGKTTRRPEDNAMKRLTAVSLVLLSLVSCSAGGSRNSPAEAPLQEYLVLTYSVTGEYKGRFMSKTETFRFEKTGDNLFNFFHTVTEPTHVYNFDPIQCTGYFLYNEVLDVNVGGNHIWWDPKRLASGKLGTLEVTEGEYNGKDVYILNWDEDYKAYYDKETGLFEGSAQELKDKNIKETIRRTG